MTAPTLGPYLLPHLLPLIHKPYAALKLVVSADHQLAKKKRIDRRDLAGESVLTIQELCARLGAHLLRDYEGTSLDTLRQMVVMDVGIAFLPALYIRSEIHRPREVRVRSVHGEAIDRTHALAWRVSSPTHGLFMEFANEIRDVAARALSREVTPVHSK